MKKHFREDFEKAFYEFYELWEKDDFSEEDLVTCVFALVKYKWQVYLTKNFRWWELPGGHVEKWETLDEALERELREEVWTTITSKKVYWYKKYTNSEKIPNRDGWFYPFPHSYILFYICEWTGETCKVDCPDTLDYWLFSYKEAVNRIDSKGTRKILEFMYNS